MASYKQSSARDDALIQARLYFQYAAAHILFAKWRIKAIQDFGFYDGEGQYPADILVQLKERHQEPVVFNKIKSMVNQFSGVEIMQRSRYGYRSHNFDDNSQQLAKGLTHYGYQIQEMNDSPQAESQEVRDALICGMGWNHVYPWNDRIWQEWVHPLNMLYDADDFSPYLTEMQYVIRMHWVGKEQAKMLWPKYTKAIDDIFVNVDPANAGSFTSEFFNRISQYIDIYSIGGGGIGSRVLVLEVQRKQRRKFLCGNDKQGNYFETFDEKKAKELSGSLKNIDEDWGWEIIRTVFCRDTVFEHGPLYPNIPNKKDFQYIPIVYSRRSSDAVPDGWMSPLKDPQRLINYTKLKEMAMKDSVRAVIDADAFVGQTAEEMREELSRPDALIIKNKDAQISLHPNIDLARAQIESSRRMDEELQQVSGMWADERGASTNATSSVAINSRAKYSMINQRVGMDLITFNKKRLGRAILDLIQGGEGENILAQILTPDEEETIIFNLTREINGKKVIFNDIRTLPLSVYVEQTNDYESSPQEQRDVLEALLSNPNAQMILQSPGFLKLLGIREWKRISEEMQSVNEQQMQMEQMMKGGMPIPPQQNIDQSPLAGMEMNG